jgi:23S rRNA pseudouridine1911/1915/1917 synthase
VHALAYHFDNLPMNSSERLVHRIDKDTSGLLVIAKLKCDDSTCHNLKQNLRKRNMLLWFGEMFEEGTIEGNLASLKDRMQMAVFAILRLETCCNTL